MSKARNLSDFISDATVDATEIADGAVTAAKLHSSLDLSSKTVTFADDHISGNKIHGGIISGFASTGIDDNASSTAVTIDSSGNVGIGTASPSTKLHVYGGHGQIESTSTDALLYLKNSSQTGINSIKASGDTMVFRTGGTDNVAITSIGAVGIGGDTTPQSQLEVKKAGTGTTEADKRIAGFYRKDLNTAGHEGYIHLGNYEGHYGVKLGFNLENGTPGYQNHGFYLSTVYNNENITNHVKRLVVKANGNVGIGTDSPSQKLHVVGSLMAESTSATGNAWTYYKNADRTWLVGVRGSSSDSLSFYDLTSGTDAERMCIDSSGNVGIGDSSPDFLLDVNGTIGFNGSISGRTAKIEFPNTSTKSEMMGFPVANQTFKILTETDKFIFHNDKSTTGDFLRFTSDGRAEWSGNDGGNYYIIHGKDGSSASHAAKSAEEIKRVLGSRARSGYYWLITPSDGVARQWYCDMETAGGGWILVAHTGDGQMASNPGNWFDSNNAGGFNPHSQGFFRGGGYWRTWGAEQIMVECRPHEQYFNNSSCSKVGLNWGSSNNLPSSRAYSNLPSKTFKDWCWDIYNAPGFDPSNYTQPTRDSSINGSNHFTEHMCFTWSPRGTGSPGDDGSSGPYWMIGSHHDGLHQHYEESAGGNGSTGNGGYHVVSNEDTTWSGGGNQRGMPRFWRYNDTSGSVNIWIR